MAGARGCAPGARVVSATLRPRCGACDSDAMLAMTRTNSGGRARQGRQTHVLYGGGFVVEVKTTEIAMAGSGTVEFVRMSWTMKS